jgi:hypothetical protein
MLNVINKFDYGTSTSELIDFINTIKNRDKTIEHVNNLLINKTFDIPPYLKKFFPFIKELGLRLRINEFDKDILNNLDRILESHGSAIKKNVSYSVSNCEIESNSIYFREEKTHFISEKLARFFKKSLDNNLCLFIYSLGNEVEMLIENLPSRDSYIIDGISSAVIEFFIDEFQVYIKKELYSTTHGIMRRFSPGYGDWPLSEQVKIFDLLKANMIGCTLTKTFYINPQKSVTGIMGIFKER